MKNARGGQQHEGSPLVFQRAALMERSEGKLETVGGAETDKVDVVLSYPWREQNNRVVAGMGDGAKRKIYIVCRRGEFCLFLQQTFVC